MATRRRDLMGAAAAALALTVRPLRAAPSEADAAAGMRAALERGAAAAVAELGRSDGFLGNPKVRIALPRGLENAAKLAELTGHKRQVDDLVTAMNRAAEAAVPKAKPLLVQTAKSISVQDAAKIVRGSQTSVTDYFAEHTRAPLTEQLLPIVTKETEKVALADKYNAVAGKAAGLGLVQGEDANIQRYVTRRALDGLYLMIGEEEKRIRADPVGTGSAILRQVFGR
jgi:hypothetical protein